MSCFSIHILKSQFLNQYNSWSYWPTLESVIDINDFEQYSSAHFPDFINRLLHLLPGLNQHTCDADYEGRFVERLHQGTWIGHILEHVVIELQKLSGVSEKTTFGKTRETSVKGVYFLVFNSPHEIIAKEALAIGIRLILALFHNESIEFESIMERLKECVAKYSIGPSTAVLTDAAKQSGIPTLQILTPYNWFQFNYGKYGKCIWTTLTDKTNFIALSISQNKQLTKDLLERFGIPLAQGKICESVDEAVSLTTEFDALTIKPLNSNRSHGVTVNINQIQEIEKAFLYAKEYSDDILVERYYPGNSYCIHIVGDKVVGILSAYITKITGDGKSTVGELIDELNQDPSRGKSDSYLFPFIEKDDEAIQITLLQNHLNLNSILDLNQTIILKRNDFNQSVPISDFHPLTLEHAVLCAKILNLDIAGIDLIIKDTKKPLSQDNGVVLEVNAGPGISRLSKPAFGQPQSDLGEIILQNINVFDDKDSFLIGNVISTKFDKDLFFALKTLFKHNQYSTGFITPSAVYFPTHENYDSKLNFSAKNHLVLRNQELDSGVFFIDELDLMNEGLIAKPDFVMILSIDFHKMSRYQWMQKEIFITNVFRTPLDVVKPSGVVILNGDDPRILELLIDCDAPVIYLTQAYQFNHLNKTKGSKILAYQSQKIILVEQNNETILIDNIFIEPQQVLNFMACLALSMHLSWDIQPCLNIYQGSDLVKG